MDHLQTTGEATPAVSSPMSSQHLQNRCQDKIPDTEVLERAELPSVIATMRKAQTRWAGHVLRMSDSRIPKQLLYGEVSRCGKKIGAQRKRYKDIISKAVDTGTTDLTQSAKNEFCGRMLYSLDLYS